MDKIIEKLIKSETPLTSSVEKDEYIEASEKAFDCMFDGTSKYYPWEKPKKLPKEFNIGVIVGASGSCKSTLLEEFGQETYPIWDPNKSIISLSAQIAKTSSQFGSLESPARTKAYLHPNSETMVRIDSAISYCPEGVRG